MDLGPEYYLTQMFPGVPEEVREKHRFDWKEVGVEEMVARLMDVAESEVVEGEGGEKSSVIPEHPKLSDEAMDFVLAQRYRLS